MFPFFFIETSESFCFRGFEQLSSSSGWKAYDWTKSKPL